MPGLCHGNRGHCRRKRARDPRSPDDPSRGSAKLQRCKDRPDNAETAAGGAQSARSASSAMIGCPMTMADLRLRSSPTKPALMMADCKRARSAAIVAELETRLSDLDYEIAGIEAKQGHTWGKVRQHRQLLNLQDVLATRTSEQLTTLHDALVAQAARFGKNPGEGRVAPRYLPGADERHLQEISADAKPIRLELPGEEDTNQQRMQLVIDFADNRRASRRPAISATSVHSVAPRCACGDQEVQ